MTLGVHRDGETAGQRLARPEQFQGVGVTLPLEPALLQESGRCFFAALGQGGQTVGPKGQAGGRGTGCENSTGPAGALLEQREAGRDGRTAASLQVVGQLAPIANPPQGQPEYSGRGAQFELCAGLGQMDAGIALEAPEHGTQAVGRLRAVRAENFRRGTGRGGAHVGGEVRSGNIGFMADRRDDRHAAGGNGAGEDLFVEFPQVLEASAAAGDDDDIHRGKTAILGRGETSDRLGNFGCRPPSLHADGSDENFNVRCTPAQDVQEVADRGAGGRSDHHDADGVGRQGLFAGLVEESLGPEFFLEGTEAGFEFAGAARLQAADDDLVLAARLVDLDVAEQFDLHPIAQGRHPGS